MADGLDALRARIDALDREIQQLLNDRAQCAIEVANVKMRESDAEAPVFYRPEREAQVLRGVMDRNSGPMPADEMARLFREIMSCCLSLEQPLTVSYLGPEGTYTQAAAIKHFGHFSQVKSAATIDEIFREVEAGAVHFGVVPVENSTEGMVNQTLDCLIRSTVKICGEVELPIHHHFVAAPDTDPGAIRRVFSHQQSLAQCRGWLDRNWPQVERVAVLSNGEAARMVREMPDAAAIAGQIAVDQYDLRTLTANIEDEPNNTTRFLAIGRQEVGASGADKTSLLIATHNEPGALYRILEPFHRHDISLTRLESRPARTGSWSYVFFIDFDGFVDDDKVAVALDELRRISIEVRVLGSYPQAVL